MPQDPSRPPRQSSPSRRRAIRRPNRLTASEDFQRARREGQSWSNRWLVLRAVPNSLDRSRVGFVVGKRVGKATVRNRVRRHIREAVRARWGEIAPGWDLIWIAREPIRDADFSMVDTVVEQLLWRAKLFPQAEAEVGSASDSIGPD